MKRYSKISILFLFITLTLLCISAVSANDAVNDTATSIQEETDVTSNVIEEVDTISKNNQDQLDDKKIEKTTKDEIKTASKTPVSYDIKIRNKIVKNTTIEVGVVNYLTKKAIPYSNLTIELPNNSTVKTNTMKSGYCNVTMDLPVGKNVLRIKYGGTNDYYAYDYDLEVNVVKRSTNMQIDVNGSSSTGDITLNVVVLDAHNGDVLKKVKTVVTLPDGRKFNKSAGTIGKAVYSFNLDNGSHNINVMYGGNKQYYSSKTNLTVNITKQVIKKNMNFYVTFKNLYVGKTSFDLKVLDSATKKPIRSTTIKIKLANGKTYSKKTDSNGMLTATIAAPVGKTDMELSFAGNKNYNTRVDKVNFTVKQRVSSINLTIKQGTPNKIKVKLYDLVLNKTINHAPISVKLPNGTVLNMKTDKYGAAFCDIVLEEGNRTYTVTYAGNKNVSSVTSYMTINTPKSKSQVTFGVTVKNNYYNADDIVFKLIDVSTNKTISNTPLNIILPSKTVKCVTDANGVVELQTNMSIGNNQVTISFNGNDNYLARNASVTLVINKRPSQLKGSLQIKTNLILNLTVTDRISNKAIANAQVLLKHPAKNITLVTDSQGNIYKEVVLPEGTASIVAQFIGNSMYANSNNLVANITIPKTKN